MLVGPTVRHSLMAKKWRSTGALLMTGASTRPGSINSPASQLAWNAEIFTGFGNTVKGVDPDLFLTNGMLYWLTGTAGSSSRLYYEDAQTVPGKARSQILCRPRWLYFLVISAPSVALSNAPTEALCTGQNLIVEDTSPRWRYPELWIEDIQGFSRRFR
jgi:hypothetical protein